MDEMETLRIEAGLERQGRQRPRSEQSRVENRDSGDADVEVLASRESPESRGPTLAENPIKRSALSNSLLDIADIGEKPVRRGSIGSLDSGMSISFQSSSTSTVSRDSSPQSVAVTPHPPPRPANKQVTHQSSFLGIFSGKRERKSSKPELDGTS